MAAEQAVDLELEREAGAGDALAACEAAPRHVDRAQGEAAAPFAADDRPDRISPFANLDVEIA
ncbi:hypothetical protein D3C83_266250 [compost metagenome]